MNFFLKKVVCITCLSPMMLLAGDINVGKSLKKECRGGGVISLNSCEYSAKMNNNKCDIFIEINNNSDWEREKEKLNTIIDKSTSCRKISIYKIIRNVRSKKRKDWNLKIGTLIKNLPMGMKIEVSTRIENSDLSTSDIGTVIDTGGRKTKLEYSGRYYFNNTTNK